jgi:dienelactone hydrolase
MEVKMAEETKIPIQISVADGVVEGDLAVPERARGIVIFAHGSGSSRHSPRNQHVAEELQQAGMGTLLMDLLTSAEESVDVYTREHRFDIPLLASRLMLATDWLRDQPQYSELKAAYFGASTGAAAALVAAAERKEVAAVVSRGGRPDLAGDDLRKVNAPTLLIVGGDDTEVIELNRAALGELRCEKRMEIVPGATHLFEEPGKLEQVARLAREWFARYLATESREAA